MSSFAKVYGKIRHSLLIGGASNHLRPRSLARVIAAMKLTSRSNFLDLGSSLGWPCILAALVFDLPKDRCRGIERDPSLVTSAKEIASKGLNISYICQSIETLKPYQLKGVTHIYSFDAVFLPQTLDKIRYLSSSCSSLVTIASAHGPKYWPGWLLMEKVNVQMSCSGQAFTIYIYSG